MRFLDIEFIYLMLPLAMVLLYLVMTNKSMIERIFEASILQKIRVEQGMSKRLRLIAFFIALFFMIVALARPVYQKGVVEVVAKRANLVIALDISRSMRAKDLYPDRLRFAKKKIEEFIKKSHNLAIGLIAFGESAFIVSPITADKEALLYLLRRLDTASLSMRGTNFEAALLSAKLLFGKGGGKDILLVTDGGDRSDFANLIELAKLSGFRVFVWGVGTQKGAPIEEQGRYLTDEKGNIVIVKLNKKIAQLAEATGGAFVQAKLGQEDIETLLQRIGGDKKESKREKVVDQVEFYPYFLAVALLFLFVAFFDIPSKNLAFMIVVLPLVGKSGVLDFEHIKAAKEAYRAGDYQMAVKEFAYVAKEKGSAASYYDLGNAYYKAKQYHKAIEAYKQVQTTDKELEFQKLHNLGNSYFQLGNYDEAIAMYQKALAIKEDPDTRYNLELAKKMKKKRSSNQQEQRQKRSNPQKKSQKKSHQTSSKQQSEKGSGKKNTRKKAQKVKNGALSDREEKKWQQNLERRALPTLLYRAPIRSKREERSNEEHPW